MNPSPTSAHETSELADIRKNKDMAAFSYVWIMSVFIYFSRKESAFIQYHSKQGMVLFLMTIPVSLIPYVGRYLVVLIVAGMLLGFMNAATGQVRDVPLAGKLSRGELSAKELLLLVHHEGMNIFRSVSQFVMKYVHKKSKTLRNDVVPSNEVSPDVDRAQ